MCTTCENGWIKMADNHFNQCDCPLGQQLRRFTAVIDVAREQKQEAKSMAWWAEKLKGLL